MLLTDYADFLQEFHFFPTSKGKKMLHDQIHSHNILFKTVFFLFDFHVWKYYPIPRSKSSEVILFSLLMCVWRSIIPNMWDAFSISVTSVEIPSFKANCQKCCWVTTVQPLDFLLDPDSYRMLVFTVLQFSDIIYNLMYFYFEPLSSEVIWNTRFKEANIMIL